MGLRVHLRILGGLLVEGFFKGAFRLDQRSLLQRLRGIADVRFRLRARRPMNIQNTFGRIERHSCESCGVSHRSLAQEHFKLLCGIRETP